MTVNSGNFPVRNRGTVMGILLAFFALSAIGWTVLYHHGLNFNLNALYLALGVSSAVASLCAMLFIADISPVRGISVWQAGRRATHVAVLAPAVPPPPLSCVSAFVLRA